MHAFDHLNDTENKEVRVITNVWTGNRLHLYSYFLSQASRPNNWNLDRKRAVTPFDRGEAGDSYPVKTRKGKNRRTGFLPFGGAFLTLKGCLS